MGLARDRYLPRQLTSLGDRLVFANGIIALAFLASVLVVVFGGRTHRLIPLYAVGVFLSFTLSQAGMVRQWHREGGRDWRWKATINGLGAAATGVVLLVILVKVRPRRLDRCPYDSLLCLGVPRDPA